MSIAEPPAASLPDQGDVGGRSGTMVDPALQRALDLDRVVHEPARLVILAVLNSADEVDFTFLQTVTGLTKGNLSRHTARLEEAGYVAIRKYHRGKIPATGYRITPEGMAAFAGYWDHIDTIGRRVHPPRE